MDDIDYIASMEAALSARDARIASLELDYAVALTTLAERDARIAELERHLAACEAECDVLSKNYDELLFAVHRKHQGESRHQTALRYIKQAESAASDPQGAQCAATDAAGGIA